MPEKHFYARCEYCNPIMEGTAVWTEEDRYQASFDQQSPLIKLLQKHHDEAKGHNQYELYDTEDEALRQSNQTAVVVISSSFSPIGHILPVKTTSPAGV